MRAGKISEAASLIAVIALGMMYAGEAAAVGTASQRDVRVDRALRGGGFIPPTGEDTEVTIAPSASGPSNDLDPFLDTGSANGTTIVALGNGGGGGIGGGAGGGAGGGGGGAGGGGGGLPGPGVCLLHPDVTLAQLNTLHDRLHAQGDQLQPNDPLHAVLVEVLSPGGLSGNENALIQNAEAPAALNPNSQLHTVYHDDVNAFCPEVAP